MKNISRVFGITSLNIIEVIRGIGISSLRGLLPRSFKKISNSYLRILALTSSRTIEGRK